MAFSEKLRSASIFHELSDREIDFLLKDAQVFTWKSGQRIIKEGDRVDALYIVLDGTALVYKKINQELLEIQKLKKLDYFGEEIFGSDDRSCHDILTNDKLQCLKIPFKDFSNFFNKRPDAYALLVTNLLRVELGRTKTSIGLIGRLFSKGDCFIGFPLYGRLRMTDSDIYKRRRNEKSKKSA